MRKTVLSVLAACVLATAGLSGCASGEQKAGEIDYADDEAMAVIADGWVERSKALEGSDEKEGAEYDAQLKAAIQTEIDADAQLKDRQFESTEMQEDVLAYLNSLDAQMDVVNNYSSSGLEFYEKWNEAYDNRTTILKTLSDEYGLSVDGEYKAEFEKILTDGTNAIENASKKEAIEGIVSGASWESVDDGFGYYTYTAIVENTSEYDFKNVSIVVGLYDADGVRTETYANANSWKAGDKVKFEAYGNDVKADRVEATVSYYEVA